MNIVFFTNQLEIGQIFIQEFSKKGHTCKLQKHFASLFTELSELPFQFDLICAEYTMYNHENYNLPSELLKSNILAPVIFYNEPCLLTPNRSSTWYQQIKEQHILTQKNTERTNLISKNLSDYKNFFIELQNLVESETLSPYIPLMQKPKSIPAELKTSLLDTLTKLNQTEDLSILKVKLKLPDNLFTLLSILNEQKTPVGLTELAKLYSQKNDSITEDSLKVQISNLRKYLNKDETESLYVQKNKDGYFLVK